MGLLTALALATPIFGLSLTPPATVAALPRAATLGQMEFTLEEIEESEQEDQALDEPKAEPADAPVKAKRKEADGEVDDDEEGATDAPADAVSPRAAAKAAPVRDKSVYVAQLRKRAQLAKIHRTLGITTWALTGLAVIAGTIQWRNLYAGKTAADTPCGKGNAWLGQDQCWGTPWFHALTGFGAGASYFATLGLAIAMPDPDNAAKGDSQYAKTLRTHKILRWVHLSGMVAQIVMGAVLANPKISGDLDRANDYKTQRALSLAHLSIGFVTLGALSWAGTIMLI